MDILILNWKDIKDPDVGGAEIIVYELAKRLVKQGDRVTWFCRQSIGNKKRDKYEGIKIVRWGNKYTMYFFAPFYYWGLKKKPDLVLDMSNTIYWQTPIWALRSKRIAYLNQLAQEVFDYEYPPIISYFGKLVERIQYLTYCRTPFLCYSDSTKKDIIALGIPAKNIRVFPLGLDHNRYFPGEKSKTPLFICVSRLVKMKRIDLAIKAMHYVVEKHPNARLAILGYGYERKSLEILRNKLKLQESVFFQDENILFFKKSAKDLKVKLMQKAWALIFPSVKEGWGMTVTECAACGTPAIVSNVTGLCDSVINKKTGLILSKNPTPEELASAMVKIIKDRSLGEKLSKNATEWSKNFSWKKSFNEFYTLIKLNKKV